MDGLLQIKEVSERSQIQEYILYHSICIQFKKKKKGGGI